MEIFGMSDIGKKRKSNQDVFYCLKISDDLCFSFVCDGMGGQSGGDVASRMVKDLFCKRIPTELQKNLTEEEIKNLIFNCYEEVNENIFDTAKLDKNFKGMGTTCSTVVIVKNNLMVFNVGDSRVYFKDGLNLKQLTKDHSYVQILIDSGIITKEEAKIHPRKNEITKAVGIVENIVIDYKTIKVKKDDVILLCTDGLTNVCTDKVIDDIINTESNISLCVENLVNTANLNGGNDNITVVLIKI